MGRWGKIQEPGRTAPANRRRRSRKRTILPGRAPLPREPYNHFWSPRMKPTIRLLEARDFRNGFIEALSSLAPVNLSPEEAEAVWQAREAAGVHTAVAERGGRVIGTASLIVE